MTYYPVEVETAYGTPIQVMVKDRLTAEQAQSLGQILINASKFKQGDRSKE